MNEALLEEIGLTKGEIKVYLTLLKIGETTTGKIIDEAQISSGKIYEILEKLIKKGLVSYTIKEKTKYFQAASPHRIVDYIHEKEKELNQREHDLMKELPVLLSFEKAVKNKESSHTFKGLKGIQTAIFEALENMNSSDEVFAFGIRSTKDEKYNILWEKWHNERIRKKIVCKAIFSDKNTEYYKAFKKMKLMHIKFLEGITPSAIDVMKDRVLIFTYENEPSCLAITNSEIAKSFRTFFQTLWSLAKS